MGEAIDYILCYSTAFFLGFSVGFIIACIAIIEKDKRKQWRRKHGIRNRS